MTSLHKPVYLDYAATTPVDARVATAMSNFMTETGVFANPSSQHAAGRAALLPVQQAARQVADLIGASEREIVWTSGATESNNLALKGTAMLRADRGRHIVTLRTEHKAVLDVCDQLQRQGFEVTRLSPQPDGLIDPDSVAAAMREDTILVSVMQVNNEIGVIQDVAAIGAACRQRDIVFHVDAAQAAGKVPIDVAAANVDLMSLSAHKVYGPKGIGALYLRSRAGLDLPPLIHGGGHQRGLRAGTVPTHQVVGMGIAFQLAGELIETESRLLRGYRERFWQRLGGCPGVRLNGHPDRTAPGIINFCVDGVEGESLHFALRELSVSSGAACNSLDNAPSYVLRALGLSDHQARSSVRVSWGRQTTVAEIDFAATLIRREVERLRAIGVK